MIDPIIQRVLDKFQERSAAGVKKYGTTLADNPEAHETYWLRHLQEELMDAVNYLEARIKQIEDGKKS